MIAENHANRSIWTGLLAGLYLFCTASTGLSGCVFLDEDDLLTVSDRDGDGWIDAELGGDDCDDGRADVHPGAPDAWYDGTDANCDEAGDFDADGDGFDAWEHGGVDCDDATPTVGPDPVEWVPDCDGDGVPARIPLRSCGAPRGAVANAAADCDGGGAPALWRRFLEGTEPDWDCDDDDPAVSPELTDTPYNGIDDDCDGENDFDADNDGYVVAGQGVGVTDGDAPFTGDCDDGDPAVNPGAIEVFYDGNDGDCSGDGDFDQDGDGYSLTAAVDPDCNDADPSIHPGAEEVWYDGVDDDCDGVDDDQDGDGWGRAEDCDDLDPSRNPDAVEVFYDGIDGDCAGDNDFDADGDGFVAVSYPSEAGGTAPELGDCDDGAATSHPGAVEIFYDGIDADCAGDNDYDADGDGYVRDGFAAEADDPTLTGDCADDDAARNPGAPEAFYDGVDSDCDGGNDYDADGDGAVPAEHAGQVGGTANEVGDCDDADPLRADHLVDVWYDGVDADCRQDNDFDADGDGYVALGWADRVGGTAPLTGDCDDFDLLVHPDAVDFFYDGVDADCAGDNDFDLDRDGFTSSLYPGQQGGSAPAGGDCNDGNPVVNPDALEVFYDGIDGDCDGFNDFDADRDGYVRRGFDAEVGGSATLTGDCDDAVDSVNPGAFEVYYDGLDGDCDDRNDWDADGDGHLALGYESFVTPGLRVGDCDDLDAAAFPGNVDVPYDGIDGDCDGWSDFDRDRDGYDWDAFGGLDCNDDPDALGAAFNPDATDVPYDGVDRDCAGNNDYDADGDGAVAQGFDASVLGGTATQLDDCDDDNPLAITPANRVVGPDEDLAAILSATCGGDTVFLAASTYDLTGSVGLDHDLTVVGPGRVRAVGAHRVLDLTNGTLTLQDVAIEGGTADDGGCIRVAPGAALYMDGGAVRDCTATGNGGGIHATAALVSLTDVVVGTNSAASGAGVFGRDADVDLLGVATQSNTAIQGGGVALQGASRLDLSDSVFNDDTATDGGAAIHLSGAPVVGLFADVDVHGPQGGGTDGVAFVFEDVRAESGAVVLDSVRVVGAQLLDYDCTPGVGCASAPPETAAAVVFRRNRDLSVDNLTVVGGSFHSALDVDDPVGATTLHDIEVRGSQSVVGIAHADGGSCSGGCPFTATNVMIASMYANYAGFSEAAGFDVDRFLGPAVLDHVTVGHTLADGGRVFVQASGSVSIRNSVFSPTWTGSGARPALWFFDANGGLSVSDSHGLANATFFDFTAGSGNPFAADNVTIQPDASALVLPPPGFDGRLDPSHPIVTAGVSTDCSASGNPTCAHPGFWGGVEAPR